MLSNHIFVSAMLAFGVSSTPLNLPVADADVEMASKYTGPAITPTISMNLDALVAYQNGQNATLEARQLDKHCDWNDSIGSINCDYFSVVFGDNDFMGHYNVITIKGNDFTVKTQLDCSKGLDRWSSFTFPPPYTVEIHNGNACKDTQSAGFSYDNIWIRYANQYLDLLKDTCCGSVLKLGKGHRCIISRRPTQSLWGRYVCGGA